MKTSSSAFKTALIWLGFDQSEGGDRAHGHTHDGETGDHGHTHGVIDPTIATTERGIWAIKWSFVILATTALFQIVVVLLSGSVALLADTIHNVGDAATAIPLWIAFRLVRRGASSRFTYGLGRVEDLAGVAIVIIILFSAIIAGYEAINHLLHPQPIQQLMWVAAAGLAGFVGNEVVAIFRIRVGREINSAALIADGYHARTDGLTSLAVVVGAVGVWFGFPLADPIIGLLITLVIFGIVWQSAKAIFTRMLDGIEPQVIDEIRHAAEHVPGVRIVLDTRARWLGHRLVAELDIMVAGDTTVSQADAVAAAVEHELMGHIPALKSAHIRIRSFDTCTNTSGDADGDRMGLSSTHQHGHAAPTPVTVCGKLAEGCIEIVDTSAGERMRFTATHKLPNLHAEVVIFRDNHPVHTEVLSLSDVSNATQFQSRAAPAEPHEFIAELRLRNEGDSEVLPFIMHEPHDHH
ncbi:MAG TPA: cation diffusion facilitator family transporter [Acidocella sp.]|jgi:cation diffusion facilitator family transporter|uniref:cation diffusion facilitator family transporter n=1 Tax=Halothiobacillus neapolitanus TaxID=927 RepID=UPI000BCDD810|nr:cation diffusion facilitator family transporter [Halothiobacillus neapolitanus]OYY72747.1 MAG: cation-efflux pump [Gammaproteobacteria bacterium 28-57-27]OZB72481.1 MAG: cation-efflux pump [Thiomonas sp. 14-64-326]HQS60076.1 cation diffusion facilitator family transporter [Gallionellaceae bacterium]HQT39235.1 cation diffusion facilitator family transporter [Acidocella sp.]TDN57347.1 cation diffusion facilitator family transporter [Halothiobacillus neapolitanus]